jgi:hypothetical protein
MSLARTRISIEKTTLDRFFRAYPVGKRSQTIQRLIEQDLDYYVDRLARTAEQVESDSEFHAVREEGERWERATDADGLDTN